MMIWKVIKLLLDPSGTLPRFYNGERNDKLILEDFC